MKSIDEVIIKNNNLTQRVLQFGEGNFLRAFADWYIDKANKSGAYDGSVVVVQPRNGGHIERLSNQNSLYNVVLRGKYNGNVIDSIELVDCISNCINPYDDYKSLLDFAKSDTLQVIISNTTESGIEYIKGERLSDSPNISYPAKLTAILYERYKAGKKGVLVLPVELIEDNSKVLKKYVLQYSADWFLEQGFIDYINNECAFCSTLVDRIVTGYPKNDIDVLSEKLGYNDNCIVAAEPYNSWIIEGDSKYKHLFPIDKISSNVIWCSDLLPYRNRKVRILNGAHTMSVLGAYLAGFDIVRDMMNDADFYNLIQYGIRNEIIPTINDLSKEELNSFASSVLERFDNPFIDHKLLDISLNSVSKYKVRCLPTVVDYINVFGNAPKVLSFGMAALITFYNGKFDNNQFVGKRAKHTYVINDSFDVCNIFYNAYNSSDTIKEILGNIALWGRDLTMLNGFYDTVKQYFDIIQNNGVKALLKSINNGYNNE